MMLISLRSRAGYANVTATIALFVALSGGAYATITLPANSVGTQQLKNKSVTPAKVALKTIALFKAHKGESGPPGPQGAPGQAGPVGPSNAYFNSSSTSQASVSVPPGDYVVYGQCDFSNSGGSPVAALAGLTGSTVGGFGTADPVTIPANGSAEASDGGVAHLTAAGTLVNDCTYGPNGSNASTAITAIKVGAASP